MQQNLTVPIAIVVAGALIAGALFLTGSGVKNPSGNTAGGTGNAPAIDVPAVTAEDHILGNPDADIIIVEYSDFECPFCKQFHTTLGQIIDEYGVDGRVAWVYRHFPLAQLHSKAATEAEASECAWEQGGNDAFWAFANRFFELTPSNDQTDIGRILPQIAGEIGLDVDAFNSCLSSGTYRGKVERQFNDAIASGGQGTPHNILILKNGNPIELPGAQPYATVKNVIETILAEQ